MPFTTAALTLERALAGAASGADPQRRPPRPADLVSFDGLTEVGWDLTTPRAEHDRPGRARAEPDRAEPDRAEPDRAEQDGPWPDRAGRDRAGRGSSRRQPTCPTRVDIRMSPPRDCHWSRLPPRSSPRSRPSRRTGPGGLDGRLVAAYGALHTVIGEQHAAHEAQLPDGWNPGRALPRPRSAWRRWSSTRPPSALRYRPGRPLAAAAGHHLGGGTGPFTSGRRPGPCRWRTPP